jgi:acyl-CoA reductase-like NAD-dependent aldehyde dehydrogenase
MPTPLFIGGREIVGETFETSSPFYPGYTRRVAKASPLDVAAAIGCARQAEPGSPAARKEMLQRAADAFTWSEADLEYTVRMTGMPLQQVQAMYAEIPDWLRVIPQILEQRFPSYLDQNIYMDNLQEGVAARLLSPLSGFCYAITPGNDPRACALLAANLGYLGIPFILRASAKDAAVLPVLRALLAGGFDPNFCSLLFFEPGTVSPLHFKLLDACSVAWTFGPRWLVDSRVRYESLGWRAWLALPGQDESTDPASLLRSADPAEIQVEQARQDHFADKIVLRHESTNCAAIACGALDERLKATLYQAIAYPLGCTATKSVMAVGGDGWLSAAADWLAGLVVGDPLDPHTQVGYIDPKNLETLHRLAHANRLRVQVFGGERLSEIQARPMLVTSQEDVPDFFAQEIPAYVLALQTCPSVEAAVERINGYTPDQPRLAVSLHNLPLESIPWVVSHLRAHAVLLDQPTTRMLPVFHEGNDYAARLLVARIFIQ